VILPEKTNFLRWLPASGLACHCDFPWPVVLSGAPGCLLRTHRNLRRLSWPHSMPHFCHRMQAFSPLAHILFQPMAFWSFCSRLSTFDGFAGAGVARTLSCFPPRLVV